MQQIDTPPGAPKPAASPVGKTTGPSPSYQAASGQSGGFIWILILLFVIGGIGFVVWRAKQTRATAAAAAKRTDPAVPITPGKVTEKEVSIYFDGLGTVQAYNTVAVNSRVDGQVVKIAFTEGQDVRTNDLLAQIDPGPFQAALDAAQAKKLQDAAQLDNALLDLQRDLALTNIVTAQALDTQSNLVRQLEAMVTNDQAGIESCQVQLDYTTIRAPLEGRCGHPPGGPGQHRSRQRHQRHRGHHPIAAHLRRLHPAGAGCRRRSPAKWPKARSRFWRWIATTKQSSTRERCRVIDNQIDATTGTIKSRPPFPNQNLSLWPGQFVNPRVLVDNPTAWSWAESVIQRGPDGEYVFTVEGEGPTWWQN